jgi:hypothetical protein
MRAPSSQNLQSQLRLTPEQAKLVRALAHAADDGEVLAALVEGSVPKTAEYVRSMHSDPYNSHMWRVTVALHAMDVVVGTFGVEALGPTSCPSYAPPYEYLNTGDAYAATLIYRRKTDTLSIGSWGDITARHPSWE